MPDPSQLSEPFSNRRDAQHPVRWSPADGDTPAYLTLKGAVERLTRWGIVNAEQSLLAGALLRTDFAFYAIDDPDEDPTGPAQPDPELGEMRPCPACGAPLAEDETHWSLFPEPMGGYVCPILDFP
jgi:hypothetical protein